jgi:hypothetical protein
VNAGNQADKLPNYTRRILLVFVGQMLLIAVLFVWSDFFPSWVNWIIAATVILFPPTAYLTVLAQPSVRQAWRSLMRDCYLFAIIIPPAVVRLFSLATVKELVRFVMSLKPMPNTVDEWITFCVLPFKTYVVVTIPMIWTFAKIISHFRPYVRASSPSFQLIFQCYLISLLALLFGALLQGIFCRPGRATTTLRYFLLGIVLLFVSMFIPRI